MDANIEPNLVPINFINLPLLNLIQGKTGEQLCTAYSVTDAFQLTQLLIHREVLPPGRKTAPAHRHSTKEEVFIVEKGNPSLYLNGSLTRLNPGDTIGLKPKDGTRMLFNETSDEVIVWTIGTINCDDNVEYDFTVKPKDLQK